MARVFLHDEMAAILAEHGDPWMTASEIARLVNERSLYKKTARAKTPDVQGFQILLRAKNYPAMFERDGKSVCLARSPVRKGR